MGHPETTLELSFRRLYPQVSHSEMVGLLNHPDFLDQLDKVVNAKAVTSWPMIMARIVGRAIDGDLSSAQFVAKKLKLIDQKTELAGNAAEDLIASLREAVTMGLEKGKQKTIDVKADVK